MTFPDNLSVSSFKGQVVQDCCLDCLSLEGGTDRLSLNVVENYHSTLRKILKERRYYLKRDIEAIMSSAVYKIQAFMRVSINYD